MSHKPIPKFANEEEEATWWDAHPEVLAQRLKSAKQQGRLRRLSQTDLPGASETVTIHPHSSTGIDPGAEAGRQTGAALPDLPQDAVA